MVKAINQHGTVTTFSDMVWSMLPPHKNGFKELGESNTPVVVPEKIIEFQAKRIAEINVSKDDGKAEVEIMKEYLDSIGVKYHPNIGYDKLKAKYDENNK
jgi:hypothetical protein